MDRISRRLLGSPQFAAPQAPVEISVKVRDLHHQGRWLPDREALQNLRQDTATVLPRIAGEGQNTWDHAPRWRRRRSICVQVSWGCAKDDAAGPTGSRRYSSTLR